MNKQTILACLLIVTTMSVNSQSLSGKKVYLAPIRPFYFLMDGTPPPKVFRDIAAKGVGQQGLVPAWAKEYTAYWNDHTSEYLYDPKGKYSVGDTLSINKIQLLDQLSAGWFTVVATVPPETIDAINKEIISKFSEQFGASVELWPSDKYISDKAWEYYDEKAVECDYYIITEITGDADYRLMFTQSTGKKNIVAKLPSKTGMEPSFFVRVTLFEKSKPGKKGKKVSDAYETIFESIGEKTYPGTAEYPKKPEDLNDGRFTTLQQETLSAGKSYADELLKSLDVWSKVGSKFFEKTEKSFK